ncbi:MAG: hypothetical protein JKX72_07080 [Robiginitomaculum sp.]|nr:hypothetical protein [Robiginitomaculum sp.]
MLLTDGHCLRDQTLSVCSRVVTDSTIRATSLDTLLGLVAGGHGITLIPTLAIREAWMSEIGVVVRPISEVRAHRKINLTVRKSNLRPELIDALGQLILAELPDKSAKKFKKIK